MADLGPGLLTLILFGSLIIILLTGIPLAFALGGVATVFILIIWPQGLNVLTTRIYGDMRSSILIAIPLFLFMGVMLQKSGIADDLYDMFYHWMGQLRGGLAAGTVIVCTLFAAMVGISGAATVTMGLLALPSMLNRGYKKDLAIGSICAGGALGILIPPSVIMIILGLFASLSVGQLFIGGILPGLLLSILFVAYILIRSYFQKDLAPALPPEEVIPWRQRFALLPKLVMPIGLMILVLGSIYLGLATPSEAAGVGAVGSILCALIKRRLTWANFVDTLFTTMRVSGMVLWIIITASIFTALYVVTGAKTLMAELLLGVPGGRWGSIIAMQLILFALGCLMDAGGIIVLTTPVFFPVAKELGLNTLWFGLLVVMNMEMAFLTPPFGLNLYFMKGVVPREVTMMDIYRSVGPFVMIQAVGLIIVMIFPQLATWLPGLMIN